MVSRYLKDSVPWSEENKSNTGLPRPFSYTFKSEKIRKKFNIAKIVPIPWQSKAVFKNETFLNLNEENEEQIYINNLCPYCGIKINSDEIVTRWKTMDLEELSKKDSLVYSDIHPFHIECMKQGRIFCPFMKTLADDDFEFGKFQELRNHADIEKSKAKKINTK